MDIASREINPNILFVSVFSGGLYECEMRRCDNLPAVMIHSGKFETNKTSILSEAFRILTTMNYSDLPTFLEISDQEVISSKQFLFIDCSNTIILHMKTLLQV